MRKMIIVAMGENNSIGLNSGLPWIRQKADMSRFVNLTAGHAVIVGRKTYESFPRRPLPNRLNIVVTRQKDYLCEGATAVRYVEEGLSLAQNQKIANVFIIGGAEIYRQTMFIVDELYATVIHHPFDADTFFPWKIEPRMWKEIERSTHISDEDNIYPYSFIRYERIK